MSQQFLDHLDISASRFVQRSVGPAESVPADLLIIPSSSAAGTRAVQFALPCRIRALRLLLSGESTKKEASWLASELPPIQTV